MKQEENSKKIKQIIAKCWTDECFKQTLLADPAATFKAEGISLLAGVSVRVLENTDKLFHLVIPFKPTALSDDVLDQVVGGDSIDTGHEGG